ncbi:MAG: L-2-amino-thiazoline-4-carboxylic acid hydrolase [Promethearchaeota archaeon]
MDDKSLEKTVFQYNKNAKIKTSIVNVIKTCLTSLDSFLESLSREIPDSINLIVEKVKTHYGSAENFDINIELEYPTLRKYPKLLVLSRDMVLSLINYNKYKQYPIEDQIEVDASDLIRTYAHFEFYYVNSLLAIFSREEAIEYIKTQETKKVQTRRDPNKFIDTLEDLVKDLKTNIGFWQTQEAIAEILNERTLVFKAKKCRWAEIMRDLDPEFGYAMLCNNDYEQTKNYNANFVLTRNNTLMEGDEYCDFCWHDTRKSKQISHPSEEFWRDLK